MIIPYSSFTDASLAADFSDCVMLFHADDFVSGSTTWTDRVNGHVMTFSGVVLKDADGLYAAAQRTVTGISGTMPTLDDYMLAISIGKLRSNSATLGLTATFGDATANAISTSNSYYVAGLEETGSSATSGNPTTSGSYACNATYYDCTDTSTPVVYEALANNLNEAIGSLTDAGPAPGFTGIDLTSGATLAFLATASLTARQKVIALFRRTSPMTLNEVKYITAEMARTQELFVGLRS